AEIFDGAAAAAAVASNVIKSAAVRKRSVADVERPVVEDGDTVVTADIAVRNSQVPDADRRGVHDENADGAAAADRDRIATIDRGVSVDDLRGRHGNRRRAAAVERDTAVEASAARQASIQCRLGAAHTRTGADDTRERARDGKETTKRNDPEAASLEEHPEPAQLES